MPIIHIPQVVELDALPRFDGLQLGQIITPETPEAFSQAKDELLGWPQVGFDTESKPTFKVGEVSTGPHLIQFASPEKGYLFKVGSDGCSEAVRAVLQSTQVLKVGFGLSTDRSRLRNRLGIEMVHFIDLGTTLRYQGKKGQVGLRGAVAAVLGTRVSKSRSVSTSNWSNRSLTDAQRLYAANDAYAALRVFLALGDNAERVLHDRIVPAKQLDS
ncbi:3'-5' exonuclease domain-containing protein 2 [Pseudomonas sp. Choline-3u-10]|jgi:ribonuclease D|uniref:3'-5' exonuclease n=1 Tax=Pseudomonadaceae TaxID=135621 RepID=UPI000617B798|nr:MULTISPECIES: 3'-5' exonuclease [Pseudomonadaceae]MBU0950817.1 3'-5' exonuclease domain-containing protein 2 [Gammaproteobacteria bacterium]KJJ65171.1 3'-5' exonuclease [Pseudomonas sp. 10B238]MBK3795607.1 3'-5' exonuclease domain-containing protein 2 [Stutzerimonas stutzeri]MBK3878038.1 3'-5' exonuclease domain-containing protein 2 [Stutzerimonas stutzeri]PKG92440.1 3'-5' exonuclease domain-containing protein 2 [Pseudomonas sp. Choline-3u-10]